MPLATARPAFILQRVSFVTEFVARPLWPIAIMYCWVVTKSPTRPETQVLRRATFFAGPTEFLNGTCNHVRSLGEWPPARSFVLVSTDI